MSAWMITSSRFRLGRPPTRPLWPSAPDPRSDWGHPTGRRRRIFARGPRTPRAEGQKPLISGGILPITCVRGVGLSDAGIR